MTRRWPQRGPAKAPLPPVPAEVAFPLRGGLGRPAPARTRRPAEGPGCWERRTREGRAGGDDSDWTVEPTLPRKCSIEAGLGVQASGSDRQQHGSGGKTP